MKKAPITDGDEYLPGTSIKKRHARSLQNIATKYDLPLYVMGSRAKKKPEEFTDNIDTHDLDIAVVIDEDRHSRAFDKQYDNLRRELNDALDITYDLLQIKLKTAAEIFTDQKELENFAAGYLLQPGGNTAKPHYFNRQTLEIHPRKAA